MTQEAQRPRMAARALRSTSDAAVRCDAFDFGDIEAGAAAVIVGGRAVGGRFRHRVPHAGHHLCHGSRGSGRKTLVRQHHGAGRETASAPTGCTSTISSSRIGRSLELPAGRGAKLRADMRALVDELRTMIPATFESEEYAAEVERINTEFKERAEQALSAVSQEAQRRGLAMLHTPVGFTFAPQKDGEVMSQEAFEALQPDERKAIQQAAGATGAGAAIVGAPAQGHADRVREFSRAMTRVAVERAGGHPPALYRPATRARLSTRARKCTEHADSFRARRRARRRQIERQAESRT
jgi:hypothetical protein